MVVSSCLLGALVLSCLDDPAKTPGTAESTQTRDYATDLVTLLDQVRSDPQILRVRELGAGLVGPGSKQFEIETLMEETGFDPYDGSEEAVLEKWRERREKTRF